METINSTLDIPVDYFDSLLEDCFGESLGTSNYKDLIIVNMFPVYYQFANMTSLGHPVIGKKEFLEENVPTLTSIDSLSVYKALLNNSEINAEIGFSIPYKMFRVLRSVTYHGYEIMDFEDKGISDEEVLHNIGENALAYYYWCLTCISDGRRIGTVGYKNGEIDFDEFVEFDMQRFVPNYNEKKSFSFDEDEFLRSGSDEEIGNALVDFMADFKNAYKKGESGFVLNKLLEKIKKYSSRLHYDYNGWIKDILRENDSDD